MPFWSSIFAPFRPQRPHRDASISRRERQQSFEDTWSQTSIPPLCIHGLLNMESRANDADRAQLLRWICEIDQQLPEMDPSDREYAVVLRLKLQRLVDDSFAPLGTRRLVR